MTDPQNTTPAHYALLIAVDFYFPNRLPGGYSYGNLGGCVNDVNHVESLLKRKLDLPDSHIIKLTASATGQAAPPEPENMWPTYNNMIAAFDKLTTMARAGDQVYIHYSGHGGRTKTMFPEKKGPNAHDEALVPTDIGNSESRYLRDVELAHLLQKLVDQGLVVAVVLDSCHSGGMTRGVGNAVPRGIGVVDETERPTDSLVAPREVLLNYVTQGSTRNVTLGSGWLPEPKGYTLISACRPNELAYEDVFAESGNERNGALTYWLLNSLEDLGPGLSYKVLHDRILARVHGRFDQQSPQLQGEGDRVVFGRDQVVPVYAINVFAILPGAKSVRLGAGQAHGLRKGAQFNVYPHGTVDFSDSSKRLALLELTELGAAESVAQIVTTFGAATIQPGDQAVQTGAGSVKLMAKVGLVPRADVTGIDQAQALDAVRNALQGNGWLEVADAQIDYQVAVNQAGEYEIWNSAGAVIENLRPALKLNAPDAAAKIVRRLEHLTRYNIVRTLDNHDTTSPLARKLTVALIGKQADYEPGDAYEPEPFSDPGGSPILKPNEWTFLRIRNEATVALNVTLLDLQPDWGISQAWPAGAGDNFVLIDPGEERILPLRGSLPEGYQEGSDILKVFATVGASNFRWLELSALDQPQTRSVTTRGTPSALEQMMAAIAADQPATRNVYAAAYPSAEWVTAQVEVHVRN